MNVIIENRYLRLKKKKKRKENKSLFKIRTESLEKISKKHKHRREKQFKMHSNEKKQFVSVNRALHSASYRSFS